jgi:diguanylate cyclase (GGDEF)-like protein/PAS domain S-box-containing protein
VDFDYKSVVENIFDGLYLTDRDRKIVFWNREAERITGYRAAEILGSHCWNNILMHVDGEGCNLCKGNCPLSRTIQEGIVQDAEVFLHHKDGHRVPVWVRSAPLRDPRGNVVGGIELFTDLSGTHAIGQRLKELHTLSFADDLTQLANRRFVSMELRSRLAELERYDLSFGVLMMDVDDFKSINDTHGHDVGDHLLRAIAKTLLYAARPFDLFGRWGGDEFVGILRNVDRDGLARVAGRIGALVRSTQIHHGPTLVRTSVSMGGCLARPGDTLDTLTKRADEMLYRSKKEGADRVSLDSADTAGGP